MHRRAYPASGQLCDSSGHPHSRLLCQTFLETQKDYISKRNQVKESETSIRDQLRTLDHSTGRSGGGVGLEEGTRVTTKETIHVPLEDEVGGVILTREVRYVEIHQQETPCNS